MLWLGDLADILEPNETLQIIHEPTDNELFSGTVRELVKCIRSGEISKSWMVCEVLRTKSEMFLDQPIYYKPTIITVM